MKRKQLNELIEMIDRLRMMAGLSPNMLPEDAHTLLEAADLFERIRDEFTRKPTDDRQ